MSRHEYTGGKRKKICLARNKINSALIRAYPLAGHIMVLVTMNVSHFTQNFIPLDIITSSINEQTSLTGQSQPRALRL